MNIFVRVINNLKYAHYKRIREESYDQMLRHYRDGDIKEAHKYAKVCNNAIKKCIEIPIKWYLKYWSNKDSYFFAEFTYALMKNI